MAESSGEKTEMPTPKKLRDARQKGQVCTSKDIVSTALLVVLFAVLAWMGGALMLETQQLVATVGGRLADPANGAVTACGALTVLLIFKYSFIFVLVAAVVGIVFAFCLAASFLPAWLAARLDPVKAINQE